MAAGWYRSKTFIILAAVVGLVVVALLVAPYLLDLNRYKPLIVSQLEQAAGRKVEIESLRLHFLPSTRVVVSGIRVKNPEGFPAGDTAAVKEVEIGLALMPLLRREVEITSVTVDGVELNLLTSESGETNYDSLLKPRPSAGKKTEAPSPVSLARVGRVGLADIRVNSGTFWQGDKRVHPAGSVSGLSLSASGFDFSDKRWMSKVEATVDLDGVAVSTPALKEPLRFTEGRLSVSGNVAEGQFSLSLGKLDARGTVKVADVQRFSAAEFTLGIKELDLADVAGLTTGKKSAGPHPPAGSTLLARGTVQVDRLVIKPLAAQRLNAKVRLYSNRLEVDPFTLELYDGRTQGTLALDLAGEAMLARLNARLEGINMAKLLAAAAPDSKKKITGTLEADARLGVPLGAPDPLAGAAGDGTFAVRNGTLPGIDLGGTLVQMAKFMQIDVPKGDTRFSFFGGDFHVGSGRVHSEALKLDSDALDASLRGSVGFDQTLNYAGTGMLKGQGSAQQQPSTPENPIGGLRRIFGKVAQTAMNITGMRVPFSVGGTLQQPKFSLAGAPQPIR